MAFTTITFLFTFLPIIAVAYYITPAVYKNHMMLGISLLFYAWGEPRYIVLLMVMVVVNYYMVNRLAQAMDKKRKQYFIETIFLNIFLLGYFKYYGFVLTTLFSFQATPPAFQVVAMPLGISFFTFSMISYVVDVYRKTTSQATTLTTFALYVCFFPKLLMGPIEPYHVFEKKLFKHKMSMALIDQGAKYFVIGMAQKMILADTFARCYTSLQGIEVSFVSSWMMALAFSFQIYFDFSGYSHMAIGLANMFGFPLMKNFNFPYLADSITSFWRRWHISLSQFFRDYVYIPLGGNRVSKPRAIVNLLIVWLLTGIWHGASLNFIVWGLYYGLLLIIEKYIWRSYFFKLSKGLRWLYTFILVNIGWVLFAHSDLTSAFAQLEAMFMMNGSFASSGSYFYLQSYGLCFILGGLFALPFLYEKLDAWEVKKPMFTSVRTALYIIIFILSIFYIASSNFQSFLYFQF